MEMRAIIEALTWSKKNMTGEKFIIFSDSNLLVQTFQKNWKRKANLDLWYQIDGLLQGQQVSFRWVKGHSTDRLNARCDQLAQQQARSIGRKRKMHAQDEMRLF